MPSAALVGCPQCDLLQRAIPLAAGESALCGRCGATLYRARAPSPDRARALTVAALIAYGVAMTFPIVAFEVQGSVIETTLPGAARALYDAGMAPLAALVIFTTTIFPLLVIAALLRLPAAKALRLLHAVQPWAMVEVFMLGVLVALAKLALMATVIPGVGALAVGALIVLLAAAQRASTL